jgi:exosome complex component RRP4
MIQMIEQATQTRVLIGQNGIVVVTGRTPEGIKLAVRAIRMVEEEAHTANLTQRIKVLLGIPDVPPQQQDAPRDALGGSGGAPKPEEATIDEVEEELEVEEEK